MIDLKTELKETLKSLVIITDEESIRIQVFPGDDDVLHLTIDEVNHNGNFDSPSISAPLNRENLEALHEALGLFLNR